MYLTYDEYINMGGSLEHAAFVNAERSARYQINAQAGGQTGERISELKELPEAVKDCVFELIAFSSAFSANEKQISGESQSQGGVSESISYAVKSNDEITLGKEKIINDCFRGGGCAWLLYRGACI